MLNERLQMLMKRVESTNDSNKVLYSKLQSLEKERDSLSRLMGIERQRVSEMGQVVEVVRSQMADKEIQLQK